MGAWLASPDVVPLPDARSDAEVLRAHLAGQDHAFDELVRRHRDRLWALALRTLSDREEAADALQDALVSAFRSASGYRGDASVSTWLHRITVNACLDRGRRRRARPTEPLGDHDAPTPRDPVADHETRLRVEQALALLPVAQRLAVVLVDMQGFGVEEAAAVLGTRVGTVKSRCARGRRRLAVLLGDLRPPDAPDAARNRDRPHDVEGSAGPGAGGEEGYR